MASKNDFRPWKPAPYQKEDVLAIKALHTGTANEGQQKRALDYIINVLAGTYDLTYWSDSDRDSCFADGKAFVGQQLVKLVKLSTAVFDPKPRTPTKKRTK